MKSKLILAIVILVATAFGYQYIASRTSQTSSDTAEKTIEDVHYHAGFKIFKDNEEMDFSALEYMRVQPCSVDGEHEDDHEEDGDIIHLHDLVDDVVHIHGPGATWGMVFDYLKIDTTSASVKAFNAGQEIETPLVSAVEPYQSMIFLVGENPLVDATDNEQYLTDDYIKKIEEKGESCTSGS